MALSTFARRSYQIKYLRVYLATRNTNETYDGFTEITRFVEESDIGKFSRSIDSDDFDIGFHRSSSIKISLDNSGGKFIYDSGFFEGKLVDRSRIQIVAGYRDPEAPTDDSAAEYETTFEGIIDDRATVIDAVRGRAKFTVVALPDIINRLRTDPGAVTNGQSFQLALFNLLNAREITQLLTVDIANINPKIDLTIDDFTFFTGKQLKSSINALLLASNSVIRTTSDTVYIVPRTESASTRFNFYGQGSVRPANVLDIRNYGNGMKRVITQVEINDIGFEADNSVIVRNGARAKAIDLGFLTDSATIATIANDILDEFSEPKTETEIISDFLGNEIDLLDKITIDNEGFILDTNPTRYDSGQNYDEGNTYVRRTGGVRIPATKEFKVLSITHDYRQYTSTYKVRAV